jgi:hypothetical protein
VRNWFGFLFGLAFGGGLIAVGFYLAADGAAALLTALGLTSCLYAILDIKSDILDRPEALSDARLLAQSTGIPTLVWGLLWVAVALLFSGWIFRKAFARAGAMPTQENEIFKA